MTRHMKIDRLSISRLNGTSNVPLLIQVQYVKSPAAFPANRASTQTKEAHTTPGPTSTVKMRGRRQPRPPPRIPPPPARRWRVRSAPLFVAFPHPPFRASPIHDASDPS